MGILVKFLLRNMKEKKTRTCLIVLSIVMSTAFFFASGAIFDTMVKMLSENARSYYGSADIIIQPNEGANAESVTRDGLKGMDDRIRYTAGTLSGAAQCSFSPGKTAEVSVIGINMEDYQKINPISFDKTRSLSPFTGKKAMISSITAERYGLKTGDLLELEMQGIKQSFVVSAITFSKGIFFNEGTSPYVVVPEDVFWSGAHAKGKYDMVSLTLEDPSKKQPVIDALSARYKNCTVKEPVTLKNIRTDAGQMSTTLMLMTIVVSVMSIFIIFTSFKLVALERLPVIGTFRSIGATKRMTHFVLRAESALYGIIGGTVGCALGLGILYLLAIVTKPSGLDQPIMQFSSLQLIEAFVFALVLSMMGCILPIGMVSKISLKDLVLNKIENYRKKSLKKLAAGLIMLAAAFIGPMAVPKQIAFPVGAACLVLSIVSVILIVPYIVHLFVHLSQGICASVKGNIGYIAVKNLKDNRSILTNISLLAIGIASLLTINAISTSVVTQVLNYYKTTNYDISISKLSQADGNTLGSISGIKGVKEVYPCYLSKSVGILEKKGQRISTVQGVDTKKFSDFWDIDFLGDQSALLKGLDAERSIIVSSTLREKLGVRQGDLLTLNLKNGNKAYKVIGFMNYGMNNGNFALASEKYLTPDDGHQYFSSFFIKTEGDRAGVLQSLKNLYGAEQASILSIDEAKARDRQKNESIFNILRGFSILALMIGMLGIVNNLVIHFMERKRYLGVIKSIGMARRQMVRMLLAEAVLEGFIGGAVGVFIGFFMISGIPKLMESMDMPMRVDFPLASVAFYIAAAILCTTVAALVPMVRSSRLNIIEAIKYE